MKFSDFEVVLSKPRIEKYLKACDGDKRKALRLYRYNIKLCQRFYGVLGIFEIALRNAINNHFKTHLSDRDWLVTQSRIGFLARYRATIIKEQTRLLNNGIYTNDKLLASLSFGVWTYMFSRNCYRSSGKTLLAVFPNKLHGLNQKSIYRDLDEIRIFRNRIAHHEPLCFDRNGVINVNTVIEIFELIKIYFLFMGYEPREILYGIETPMPIISKIRELSKSQSCVYVSKIIS